MNERIRELAEHAEMPNPHTPGSWTFNNRQLKFFAELIVQETLQVARAGIEFGDSMEDAVYKYFGVE